MSVGRVEGDTVVAVPAVQDRLDLPCRDGGHDGPGGLSVVGLPRSMFVEAGVVHDTARIAVVFGCDDHPVAPGDWSVDRDFLQDTKAHISVQALLDSLLPVEGNLAGTVNCDRLGLLVNKDPEGRRAVHQVEGLVLTDIEGAGLVSVQDVLAESGNILWCGSTGENCRSLRRKFSLGTGAGVR